MIKAIVTLIIEKTIVTTPTITVTAESITPICYCFFLQCLRKIYFCY
jgi:hypothetical protein